MTDPTALIEAAASPFRERSSDGRLLASPAWSDLDADGRREAFEVAGQHRALEAARDPRRLSGTAKAVLGRIGGR